MINNPTDEFVPPAHWLKVYECGFTQGIGKRVKVKKCGAGDGSTVYLDSGNDHNYGGHVNCYSNWGCVLPEAFKVGSEYEVKYNWTDPETSGKFTWLEEVIDKDSMMLTELEKQGVLKKVSFDSETQVAEYVKNTTNQPPQPVPNSSDEIWWTYKSKTVYYSDTAWVLDAMGGKWYTKKNENYGIRRPASFTVQAMDSDSGTYVRIPDPRVKITANKLSPGQQYLESFKATEEEKEFLTKTWFDEMKEFDILEDLVDSHNPTTTAPLQYDAEGEAPPPKPTIKATWTATVPNYKTIYDYGGVLPKVVLPKATVTSTSTISKLGGFPKSNIFSNTGDKEMKFGDYVPKTQKSRGLIALVNAYVNATAPIHVARPDWVFKASEELPVPAEMPHSFPKFARPCPLTPRHGFVDSRIVSNREQLEKVRKETFKADPDGEVMIMPFINAHINMVWTPALLTLGDGHDGATAGKSCVSFPLNGIYDSKIKSILTKAGVDDYPYVEAVVKDPGVVKKGQYNTQFSPWLTQLRNGPVLDTKPDYIPKAVVVTKVIKPNVDDGDLLGWEKKMLDNKGVSGVVVWHPTGSQADHFAIHARSCKIPCIVTFEPKVGDSLKPVPTIPPSYPALIRGLVAGAKVEFGKFWDYYGVPSWSQEADSMLITLHNSSAMEGESIWWFGAAISTMLRLGSMALRGEARHLHSNHGPRNKVYEKCAKTKLQAHAKSCGSLINIFKYGWPHGKTGIGGLAWAQCGLALGDMFNAVRDFIKDQNDDTYGALVRSFNTAVNQAHNGGWWMNKFTHKDRFDKAQNGDLKVLLESTPFMWELAKVYNSLNQDKVTYATRNWGKWPTTDLTPPKTKAVKIDHILGSSWVTLNIKDGLLKDKRLPISINLKNLLKRVPPGWTRDFIIRETSSGLAVDIVFPGIIDEPITIWKESKIKVQAINN